MAGVQLAGAATLGRRRAAGASPSAPVHLDGRRLAVLVSVPNRLSLHVAQRVAAAAALAAGAAVALAGGPAAAWLGAALGVGLAAGAVAYGVVERHVSQRLEVARSALRDARKRRFDALARLSTAPGDRDEIDAMIWQVLRAGRAMQVEIERLEQMESYRRDFLGDVSHELRTPIFAIAGFAETLLDGALDDEAVRRRFVEKVLSNAQRLQALTHDLTQISRLETGRLALAEAPFELRALTTETAEGLAHRAEGRRVVLSVRVPRDLPRVHADRARVAQVLTNLVENAIEYNEPGGRVEIVARRLPEAGRVRVSVVDDGIGIAADALPRLTERFYRVDKSRSRTHGGTGLGLAIVKHLLEAMGTELHVESRLDYGSTFSFELRAEPEPAERPEPAATPA